MLNPHGIGCFWCGESPPKEVVQNVSTRSSNVKRMISSVITDDLLDVSRFCRGKVELQIKRIYLNEWPSRTRSR